LKNEATHIPALLASLERAAAVYGGLVTVVVVANDCTDGSIELLRQYEPRSIRLEWRAVSMLPGARHAGWARRLAFDAAAAVLKAPDDLLLSTDADTQVSPNWIRQTVAHVDLGYDAVAGHALTRRDERRALGRTAKSRLDRIGRYYTALAYLQTASEPMIDDPWPRHFYEGGASIALTARMYRKIGGAPTPRLAEDKALFDRIRAYDGRIRHPVDVRVFTSCRTQGRAPGGMADAVALWIAQAEDAPLHELYSVAASLGGSATAADQLSFRTLKAAQTEAQARIRALRARSAPLPEVEPVLFAPFGESFFDQSAQVIAKSRHRLVAAQGIVGFADPVDQEDVAA
jgi:hypothetical protein